MAKATTANVLAPPPVILMMFLVVSWIFQKAQGIAIVGSLNYRIAGTVLVLISILILYWAAMEMKKYDESPKYNKATKVLVSTGPFALSRNPLYLATLMSYIGIALVLKLVWPLILLPLALILIHFTVIIREENYLQKQFGKSYVDYKKKARRYF